MSNKSSTIKNNTSLKKNTKVSIIIPCYNAEKYLHKAIESLLIQTYENIEIILVDNGSQDSTQKIIKKYAQKSKKIKTKILQKNMQPGGGRNAGAKIASGDIFVFIDSDMIFKEDYIEKLIEPILEGKEIGSLHGTELVANKENIWARTWCINRIPSHGRYSGVFRAITKKAFLNAGGFDTTKGYFDDNLSHIGQAIYIDKAICYHNNPDTLKKAFEHSVWVGKSFAKDTQTLKEIIKSKSMIILAGSIIIAGSLISNTFIYLLLFCILIGYSSILIRCLKENDATYLLTVPILNSVKYGGYMIGLITGKPWQKQA